MTRATGSKRSAEEEGAAAAVGYHGQHAHSYGAHSLAVTSSSAAAVGSTAGLPTTTTAISSSSTAAAAASNASSATVGYRPMAAAAAAYPVPNGKSEMVPRTQSATVSEEVWAKAIHAVKIQKMSLRQAAQLYGVHHMSLHRRVRGRYASPLPPSADIRAFLSPDDEAEALGVLREQFLHEKRITTDDIRFVVRAIASQGGKQSIPAEFPPSRWIHDFKRAHGFVKLNNYAYPMASSTSQQGDDDVGADEDDSMSNYSEYSLGSSTRSSHGARGHRASAVAESRSTAAQQNGRRSGTGSVESNYEAADREDYNSSTPNGSSLYDTGLTTGSSSGGSYENGESEKRTYRLSHTVPPETWEKAIAAVEQQGMSLRSAAKMYGVHFAALHRRVKKRAQGEQATGIEGYFQPDDEAGIIRVVVARAELGVLMNFDELMDLAQRAALRNLPDLSVEAARKLMTRFQSRNEHSIRHIIADWPSPHSNPHTAIPRVVNNPEQLPRSSSAPSALRGPTFSGARPPSPRTARNYAAARNSEQPLGRIQSLPDQQQQQQSNGDLVHSPLPPLRSEFPPPPPASSIFSRHNPSPLAARRVPQPMSSAAAAAADHDSRYGNHDDRAPRRGDHHHPYDSNSSYDDDDDHDRRDSGSSEGDAVMFV